MKRRTGLAVAALLIVARAAEAAPPPPQLFGVRPVYTATRAIRILIVEAGGATSYTIHKKIGTSPEMVLTSLPGGPADHRLFFLDTAVVPSTQYTYRVDACNATGCVSMPPFTTSVDVVWPISGGRRVLHGFNEVVAWDGINGDDGKSAGFHDGVDLGRTTAEGSPADDLLAPRGGVVVQISPSPPMEVDNGFIEVQVDVGDHFELDGFNHISSSAPVSVMQGQIVAPGQKLAVIGTRHFDQGRYGGDPLTSTAFDDHLHFQLGRTGSNRITIRHPLTIFTDPADRDPLGHPPALNDENGDGKMVLYRDHATGTLINYDFVTTPLRGDVDVAAEITDVQGTKPETAPITLGYWIEGPLPESEHHDDVKSTAHPYRLYDFRSEYWGLRPETPCDALSDLDDAANYGCAGLKTLGLGCSKAFPGFRSTCASVLKIDSGINWGWPILHHFVVTHAALETGARNGLNKNQFWRTAAKDDNGAVGSAHANYAGQPVTTKAWEARFPDGDYTIHLIASDLVHTDVDVKLPVARLENFAPFIREIVLAEDADGNPATGLPDAAGCELEVYAYRHPARKTYPDPIPLAVARGAAALTQLKSGTAICVRVRFSEPMTSAGIELVGDRGAGATIATLGGSFEKTHQDNDTWRGTVTLAPDPSGDSDSSLANDEKDVALRVTAGDRRNAAGVIRALDTDGDGLGNAFPDVNHLVKLDLSPMKKEVRVVK